MGNRVDIINSTLGKAVGGAAGGYTAGPKELIQLLRQRSRPYLFSNSLPPPVIATAAKVLTICLFIYLFVYLFSFETCSFFPLGYRIREMCLFLTPLLKRFYLLYIRLTIIQFKLSFHGFYSPVDTFDSNEPKAD